MRRLLPLGLAIAALLAACAIPSGPAVLVVHNRSSVPVAFFPDATINACSTMEFDESRLDQSKAAIETWLASGGDYGGWGTSDAIAYSGRFPSHHDGDAGPVTIVIWAGPVRRAGDRVPQTELPPCGGEPEVTD